MDRRHQLVIAAAALLLGPGALAQTYQVGQYLGNMHDLNRFTYNTMGSAAQHANYTAGGANWTTLAGQNAARMTGQATATIGGRAVVLTAASRVPYGAIVNAARGVALMNPTTAAVTLLGFAAMQGWLTPAGLQWNTNPSDNVQYPFLREEERNCDSSGNCLQYNATYGNTGWVWSMNTACSDALTYFTRFKNHPSDSCQQTGCSMASGFTYSCNGPGGSYGSSAPIGTRPGEGVYQLQKYTWEQAEPLLSNGANNYSAVDWKAITQGLLQRGGSIDPGQITTTVTGPASQQGQRTERTLSNGDKQVTQTTHNYTYNNNNVTHNTTTTTTTTNINNEVVNEETETTENRPPEEPPPDLCEKNPDILACQKLKLGELEPKPVPNEDRPLAITPDSGWGPGAASCPQPKSVTVMGTQLSFEYTLFCDFAVAIKPLFIGFAWLAATLTFFGIARRD